MTHRNCIGLNWISFLSYFFTGALINVTGIVLDNIAQYFHFSISQMSNVFTFLNSGILVAVFLNAWVMVIIPLKRQLIFGFFLMLITIVGLIHSHNLILFSLCMFLLGIISGITMSIGTFLITHLYSGRQRGSRLLFTDSFFSLAGIIFPVFTSFILSKSLLWYWIYAFITIIYIAIFFITLLVEFPEFKSDQDIKNAEREKWGIGVLFLSIAALCYILGQLSFVSWVPEYTTKSMGISMMSAGQLVSHFWASYMVGMWFFSFFLRLFDLQRILMIITGISTSLIYCFIANHNVSMLNWIILALGFSSSAIYSTIITLGSLQTKIPSPKLVNFILTCGTIGTMLTFILTGPIVKKSGPHAALVAANILYSIVFIMCILVGFVSKHRQHNHNIT